jgi:hypothetical protein
VLPAQTCNGVHRFKEVTSQNFEEDSPERLPPNTFHLQDDILDATAELHELFMGTIPLVFKSTVVGDFHG